MGAQAVTEQTIINAAAALPTGLEAVYLAHRDRLLRFLRARGAGARAEDLVQELWVRIASKPTGPIMDPLSYLFRAANNLMLNDYRADARNMARDEAWGEAHLVGVASAAEVDLAAKEEVARARTRLAACGTRVQEIFFLFRVDGLSQRVIAERYHISLSAVEKDIQRAYRAIAALKDEDNG
ncbi:RNA polymerase sigma factor [Sphingopyxis sp. CCNWLW253]|uniref:RNA polymerase sigma factor n=1 Tax=unclassified Sphingopyxis TaxID=2614943 RepID=UPI003012B85C